MEGLGIQPYMFEPVSDEDADFVEQPVVLRLHIDPSECWCVVSALAPLSCGSRRIIQVDAAHWWLLRRDPPHTTLKRFGCMDIHSEDVKTVQKEVAQILNGRILVGHAIHNDLKILLLDHPKKMIRDTQKYKPFRQRVKSSRPALRVLCKEILNVKVQQGEHSSVQDAQAAMRLYTLEKKQWEAELKAIRAGLFQKSVRKPQTPKTKPN